MISPLGLHIPSVSVCVLVSSSDKDTRQIGLEAIPEGLFPILSTSLKAPPPRALKSCGG